MIHAPIYGSIINQPAKLYKRFTPTETMTLDGKEIIYENNYYHTHCSLRYIESTEKTEGQEQPLGGLVSNNRHMAISITGNISPLRNALQRRK